MNVLLELALPLLRVGGVLLAIKGERASAEIKQAGEALRTLHGRVIETNRTSTGTIVSWRRKAKRLLTTRGDPGSRSDCRSAVEAAGRDEL